MQSINRLSFVFLLSILSCTLSTCTRSNTTFVGYLKSLDNISLPFEYSYLKPMLPKSSINFDTLAFKKYNNCNCSRPIGILLKDRLNVVIMNLSGDALQNPVIVSYDKTGNKIDSLNLFEDAYQDINSEISPYLKISEKRRIVLRDTLRHWENDKPFHIKQGSIVTNIDSTIYLLSKNGKFVKEKEKK